MEVGVARGSCRIQIQASCGVEVQRGCAVTCRYLLTTRFGRGVSHLLPFCTHTGGGAKLCVNATLRGIRNARSCGADVVPRCMGFASKRRREAFFQAESTSAAGLECVIKSWRQLMSPIPAATDL